MKPSSPATAELDALLAPLARPLARSADALLDLRACALASTEPGRCVACYFQLQQAADERLMRELCPLRSWLQTRIEASACDAEGRTLETLPVDLDAEDLETCCRRLMHELLDNRAYSTSRITLTFRYRSALAA